MPLISDFQRMSFVVVELDTVLTITENSRSCLGYRPVWRRLIEEYGITVSRNRVMELMRIINEEGVESRRQRRLITRRYRTPGPNYVWHIDGYDKLKPFSFAIHGAIDGYSRRILWLEVGTTNNNPKVIAYYYLDAVKQLGGCPQRCRSDIGTENCDVEDLQRLFHSLNGLPADGGCFLYGKSTSNQCIESWWSVLRRQNTDWRINFFKDLRDSGLYQDGEPLHVECLRYCFMDVLQNELNRVAIEWNRHTLQVKRNCQSPRGKPDVMYFTPELYNTRDLKIGVD
ncbi:uncharacterized protein LOC135489386 [Lineus longissimus]|uniref:uncharacterized protein LOC135489386 n=1 Tax=Lineus longissimus TaxID=88925 RepID=UPI00315C5764